MVTTAAGGRSPARSAVEPRTNPATAPAPSWSDRNAPGAPPLRPTLLIAGGLVVLLVVGVVVLRAMRSDVLPNVTLAGTDVAGMTRDELAATVDELAESRTTELISVEVDGRRRSATNGTVGYAIDRPLGELPSPDIVVVPGGIGTLDEMFEAWTWNALGYHAKPFALLNVADFWTPFVGFMEHVSASGFLSERRLKQLIVGDTPDQVINLLDEAAAGATQGIVW